ncbi:hypothetical protein INR49_030224, partial [Caranx melampygus]
PSNAGGFKAVTQDETSITLQWTKAGNILNYILKFNDQEKTVTASEGQNPVSHTVSGLTSATTYTFTLLTVFNNISSTGVSLTASTAPSDAQGFKAVTQDETSITLEWTKVDNISNYILKFNDQEETVNASEGQNPVSHTVSGLTSATTYTFTLLTVFNNISSTGVNLTASTAPSNAGGFKAVTQDETSITLQWTKAGNILDYILKFNDQEKTVTASEGQNPVSHTVSGLTSATTYTFTLLTVFNNISSTGVSLTASTAPRDAQGFQRVAQNETMDDVPNYILKFDNKEETATASEGQNVTRIILALQSGIKYTFTLLTVFDNINSTGISLTAATVPADVDATCKYSNGGYAINVVWEKLEGVWTEVEVNVTRKTHRVFPNGTEQIKISGFQPAKTYEVSVGSLREDSGTVRRSPPYVFECYTDPTGVIAGSVLAVLLFVVLVCLAAFILLKKPDFIRKKTFIGGSKQSDKTSKAISVAKFPDHFRQLSVDDNRGFIQEYENLASVGTEQMRKAAVLPENKARNRFNNVLPYDWCRVKLSTSNPNETSDYINASYMPGYNRQREYIATQGPLPSTVCDFWRMIWEQRVKGIVMVTNCVEGGRTKCERYWPPDSNPCPHGKLLITMKSEQQEPNWTLREFSVKNTSTSEERTVKHFHFTAWPDHGVPEGTDVLIQFRELVSAGVGRTGTIIALDVLLQQFDKKRAVGINGFVHKMRLSRPYMVQT